MFWPSRLYPVNESATGASVSDPASTAAPDRSDAESGRVDAPVAPAVPNSLEPGRARVFGGWAANGSELSREVWRLPPSVCRPVPRRSVRFRTLTQVRPLAISPRRETHKRGHSRIAGLSPRTCEAMMLPPGSPVSSLRLGLASQRHLAFHATHARQARPSPVGAVRQMHTRDGGGGVEVPIFSAHPWPGALGDWLGLGRGAGLAVRCPATGLHCRHVGA